MITALLVVLGLQAQAAPGETAYAAAQRALAEGDAERALKAAQVALEHDPDHAAARLVEGHALHRLRRWEEAVAAWQQVAEHDEVGASARQLINRFDSRWRRDQPSLSMGLVIRDDRGPRPRSWKPGLALQVEAPVVWRFTTRLDLVTPWQTADDLRLSGPVLALMPAYHQPIGIFSADLGAGPTLQIGASDYWGGAYDGAFPGLRVALGGSVRLHRNVGVRLESGWGATWGVRPLLRGSAQGFDGRLMVTGYLR